MAASSSNASPVELAAHFPPPHMAELVGPGPTASVRKEMTKSDQTRLRNRLAMPKGLVVAPLINAAERDLWARHGDIPVALRDRSGHEFQLGLREEAVGSALIGWRQFLDAHEELTDHRVVYEYALWFYRERHTDRLCAYFVYKRNIARPFRTLDLLKCLRGA